MVQFGRRFLQQEKSFTNASDVTVVAGIYAAFFEQLATQLRRCDYSSLQWGATELRLLCVCAAGAWGLFNPFPRAAAAAATLKPVFLCSLVPAEGAVVAVRDDAGRQVV